MTKNNEVPTVDDVFEDVHNTRDGKKPRRKSEIWLLENPEKAKIFWAACEKAIDSSEYDLAEVIMACQRKLGGPPGTYNTVRKHVNEQLKR